MLYNLASMGENAAAMSGNQGITGAANTGSALASAGTNLAQGIQGAGNTLGNNALLAGLLANRGTGSTQGVTNPMIASAEATSPYPGSFYGVPTA